MVVLIVALMFIVLITISYFITQKVRKTAQNDAPALEQAKPAAPATYFHPAHTFAKVMDDNLVEIGMDEFAMQAFGKIDSLELPQVGRILKQGEVAWQVQVGDKKVSQPMPVTGTVVEVNSDATDSSWFIKVNALSLKQNLANLINEAMAGSWLNAVRAGFQNSFSATLVPSMQDGGELVDGFARQLHNGQWEEFCKDYFNCKE